MIKPCNPNAKLETKCLHAGYTPENGGPGVMPIVQSTTYRFDSTEHVADLFDMPMEPMYSRFANPTCDAVEQKIAALEGGVGAMLTTSGQAASLLSILNVCSAGDSFLAATTIYGGTVNLFGVTLKKLGIECICHALQGGGVIVDSGNFDWEASGKFPDFTQPDESYHGVVYTREFGKMAYIIKARMQLMRDFGCYPSAHSAFLLNLGLETLPIRMKQYCENATAVAKFLETSDKIVSVTYPGLETDQYHALAQKYLPNGTCGVISFSIKGGRPAAVRFMDALELASIEVHVADIRTCVLHPASATHRQLTEEQLVAAGIDGGLIRLSVGLEHVDDILADVKQALDRV